MIMWKVTIGLRNITMGNTKLQNSKHDFILPPLPPLLLVLEGSSDSGLDGPSDIGLGVGVVCGGSSGISGCLGFFCALIFVTQIKNV